MSSKLSKDTHWSRFYSLEMDYISDVNMDVTDLLISDAVPVKWITRIGHSI